MDGRMFLEGARVWARAGATTDAIDPATAEAFARVALGDKADVDAAVASARAAAGGWAGLAPVRRVRLLNRLARLLPQANPAGGAEGGPPGRNPLRPRERDGPARRLPPTPVSATSPSRVRSRPASRS